MALMLRMLGQGARAPRLPSSFARSIRGPALTFTAAAVAVALGGCASTQGAMSGASAGREPMFPESKWGVSASRRVAGHNERIPKGGGRYKVGDPYQVGGRWYNPREQPDYDRVGVASWYGSDFHGRHTANGEIFDMHALTAAHPTLPMPSYAYVTNISNDRTILVRINDRGPYVGERMIDLSKESARSLGLLSGGTGRVRVRYAGPAPLDGNDRRERQFLASRPWNGGTEIAAFERAESAREWESYQSTASIRPEARLVPRPGMAFAGREPTQTPAPSHPRSYADAGPGAGAGLWSPDTYRASLVAR